MVNTYETLVGRYVELLLPTVITYETLAGRYVELLLPTVITNEYLGSNSSTYLPASVL
jgi:hypothetical protein